MSGQSIDDALNRLKHFTVKNRGWSDGTVLSYVVIKESEYLRLKNLGGNEKNSYVAEFFVNSTMTKDEALVLAVKIAVNLDIAETARQESLLSVVI